MSDDSVPPKQKTPPAPERPGSPSNPSSLSSPANPANRGNPSNPAAKPVTPGSTKGIQLTTRSGGPMSNPNLAFNPNISNPGVSSPGMKGMRGSIARGLAAAANLLVKLSRVGFSEAQERGGKALSQFSQRPEHTRQRVYAFGSYSVLCFVTLLAQLWEPNPMHPYVRVEPVALPEATIIFVRNDSSRIWKGVRLTLNGKYGYQGADMKPNDYISHRVDRFAAYDQNGKAEFAPKETVPHQLSIDCDRGHFEIDLDQR